MEISSGATLLGSENIEDSPSINGRWEGIERKVYASLFTGNNLENVSITGRGVLDGQGEVWWKAHQVTSSLREQYNIKGRGPENHENTKLKWQRPRMINLCKNVLIRNITILNSISWTAHPVYCNNVTIENILIVQSYESPNTDGIDPESSQNVRILGCYVDYGNDCIAIKSGYNEEGRRVNIPPENIVIASYIVSAFKRTEFIHHSGYFHLHFWSSRPFNWLDYSYAYSHKLQRSQYKWTQELADRVLQYQLYHPSLNTYNLLKEKKDQVVVAADSSYADIQKAKPLLTPDQAAQLGEDFRYLLDATRVQHECVLAFWSQIMYINSPTFEDRARIENEISELEKVEKNPEFRYGLDSKTNSRYNINKFT